MQSKQGSMLQSLRAVKGFLDEHADTLGDVVQTGARKRLDDAIAALDTHVSDQSGSHLQAQSLTQRQRSLRIALLRDHMAAVSRIARADLPNTPEFRPLRMPRGRPTPEKLAAAATGMAQVAVRYKTTFVAAGLPADFGEQLVAAANAMLAALTDRTRTRARRRGATTGLKEVLSEGRKVVAILDAFVRTALQAEPTLLSNWEAVSRVQKLAVHSAPTSPSATSPATAEPAPASAAAPAPLAAPPQSPSPEAASVPPSPDRRLDDVTSPNPGVP